MKRAADGIIDLTGGDDAGMPSMPKKAKTEEGGSMAEEPAPASRALAPLGQNKKRVLFVYAPAHPNEHYGWMGEIDLNEQGASEFWTELGRAWDICEEGQTDPEESANAERATLLDYLTKQWHPEKDDEDGINMLKRRRPDLLTRCPALIRILKETPRAAGTWKAFDTEEGPQSLVLNGPWDAVFFFAESTGDKEGKIESLEKIREQQHLYCADKDDSDAESEHSFEDGGDYMEPLEPGTLPFPSAEELRRAPTAATMVSEPAAEKVHAASSSELSLDKPWWFMTCGEDGASYYIREWRPRSARDPARAASAILAIHAASKAKLDSSKGSERYFMEFMEEWLEGEPHSKKPAELGDLERADLGDFKRIARGEDPSECVHDGPLLMYRCVW